ncbi:MAG: hypothetical protein V3U92_02695 [Cellulophaga sp.]
MDYLLLSFFGATIQEILHLIDLKQELGERVRIVRSIDYWVIALATIIICAFSTPIIVDSFTATDTRFGTNTEWHYLAISFSFPSILRKLTKVFLKQVVFSIPAKPFYKPTFRIRYYLKLF